MRKLKKKQLITIVISLIFILAAVVGAYFLLSKEEVKKDVKPQEETIVEEKEVTIVDVDSTSRPFAVMINNHSDVRPYHSGMQDAYILYEIIVEGGITRYMGLFKDVETARIAGIRSARHYYLDYAMENDAFYIHWGYSPQAISDIYSLGINSFEVGSNYYAYRDSSLPVATEHQTYTSMADLNSAIATKGYRMETNKELLLNYSAESINQTKIENVVDATNINIKFSSSYTTSFTYDEINKVYMNSINNVSHTDYVTGAQYSFKNIITYTVNNYTIPGDDKNRQNIENIGSGTGYYISEGKAVPINWSKSSRDEQTIYTYENGEELIVNDGNTYIAIQPTGQSLEIS